MNMYDLLSELNKHLSINPEPELLAEFASKIMKGKIVSVAQNADDPAEILFDIHETQET